MAPPWPTLVFKRPKSRTSLNSWPPNQILERLNSIKITLLLVMPILLLSLGPPNTPKCCRTPALAVKLTQFCALARGKDSEITTWFHDEEIMTVSDEWQGLYVLSANHDGNLMVQDIKQLVLKYCFAISTAH